MLGTVVTECNPSSCEVEAGGWEIQGQFQFHRVWIQFVLYETKQKNQRNKNKGMQESCNLQGNNSSASTCFTPMWVGLWIRWNQWEGCPHTNRAASVCSCRGDWAYLSPNLRRKWLQTKMANKRNEEAERQAEKLIQFLTWVKSVWKTRVRQRWGTWRKNPRSHGNAARGKYVYAWAAHSYLGMFRDFFLIVISLSVHVYVHAYALAWARSHTHAHGHTSADAH